MTIGASANDGNGNSSGQLRVYEWSGVAWVKKGIDIDGNAAGDLFGENVSVNADGTFVAVGAPGANSNGNDAGTTKIYEIRTLGVLSAGSSQTYTATYTISQDAINNNGVSNSVLVTASSPGNTNDVTDISDNGDDTDGNTQNDATVTSMVTTKTIEVTKASTVIDNGDGEVGKGDIIKYNITVQNTGNVNLTKITLSDTLTDGNGNILTLTSSPTYNSSSLGSSEGSLKVSETATYTASYTIAQNAVDSGSINNTLLATASRPGHTNNVSDTCDDLSLIHISAPTRPRDVSLAG